MGIYDGLVGWWKFNGNAKDYSGQGNDGIVTGATLTTDRFSNANSAYNLNGTEGDGITTDLVLDMSQTFSLCFWIKVNSYSTVSRTFSTKFNTYGSGKVMLEMRDTRRLNVRYTAGAGYGSSSGFNTNSIIGEWNHIIWVHNEATTENGLPGHRIQGYINGVQISDGFYNGLRYDPLIPTYDPLKTDTSVFTIGNATYTDQEYDIDDVRLYNRKILPNEAKIIHASSQYAGVSK